MTSLLRFFPGVLTNLRSGLSGYSTLLGNAAREAPEAGGGFTSSVRTIMRCHFPRPNERRRILRHGWKKRMSTPAGRRILMNRILKGRFVYSH